MHICPYRAMAIFILNRISLLEPKAPHRVRSAVMYPSPSIASAFNRRVAEVVHYFLGVDLRLVGSPAAAWKAVSLRTIMRSSNCRVVSLNSRDGHIGNDGHHM